MKFPRMSYAEFLARLETTPRDWQIISIWPGYLPVTYIRRDENGESYCPSMAVWNTVTSPYWPKPLFRPYEPTPRAIIDAADGRCRHNPEIRRDLLRACGLPEESNVAKHPEEA